MYPHPTVQLSHVRLLDLRITVRWQSQDQNRAAFQRANDGTWYLEEVNIGAGSIARGGAELNIKVE
jgi:hypothetical protein